MILLRALVVTGGLAASVAAVAQQAPYQPPPYPQQPPYQPPPPAYQQPQYPQQQYPQQPPAYQQPTYPQQPPQQYQPPPQQYQQPPAYQPYPQQPPYQQPYPQQPPYQQPYPPPPAYPPPPPAAPHQASQHQAQLRYHPLRFEIGGGYTITQDDLSKTLQDGGNALAGIIWQPTSLIPLAFRIEGSYSRFNQTLYSRSLASQALGTDVAYGHQDTYGVDADAEIDLRMGPNVKEYFFGGLGKYQSQTVYKQVTYESGVVCYVLCAPAFFPVTSTVQNTTGPWVNTWNAGMGFEFGLGDPVSFFIEARYLRISPYSAHNVLVPITVGLRF